MFNSLVETMLDYHSYVWDKYDLKENNTFI